MDPPAELEHPPPDPDPEPAPVPARPADRGGRGGSRAGAGAAPSLERVAREWGRIGCTGFGGPPAHIALLRRLCVERRGWIDGEEFEHALAAANLLPGPASTQLAIWCAWRVRGRLGAFVGGSLFILPGLAAILALSALFLAGSPPRWVRGAGAGAGAAVPAVALSAALALWGPMWTRARDQRLEMLVYGGGGVLAAALVGPWLAPVILGCGLLELARRYPRARLLRPALAPLPFAVGTGGAGALVWSALKVGALAFGGGFVIVPLMQSDAVSTYHWMTHAQFLDAVALGQITPGPVVQTVAAVGFAAGGVGYGILAAAVAFAPSFCFVLAGAPRLQRLLGDGRVRAFVGGAAPCAAGAILGAVVPLALSLSHAWQYGVMLAAGVALVPLRAAIVPTLLSAGAIGVALALAAAPV